MRVKRKNQRKLFGLVGQGTAEYAVLLAAVTTALLAMQVYLKRSLQGRVKDLADQISSRQYQANLTDSGYITIQSGKTQEGLVEGISYTMQCEDKDGDDKCDDDPSASSTPEITIRGGGEIVYPEIQE